MTGGILELALVVAFAALLGVIARFLKQPIILAYLVTGVIIGVFGFFNIADRETFRVFSDLGIMFLLFLVGLEINYTSLRFVGKTSIIIGLGQIIFTAALGFLLAVLLNFSYLHAIYIAVALTFSSTIIVVKLLSDKREMGSLYGKISIGILLIQDLVAILLLLLLSSIELSGGPVLFSLVFAVMKGVILFAAVLWLGRKILPLLFHKIARSQELLFLTSIAWVFILATIADKFGFSIEIAGFLAGLSLANSSEHFQIANKIRPLRDFFILVFFAILGSSIVFTNFAGLTIPIVVFSLFVLIGNPLIILVLMGLLGYRRRTSFLTGVAIAQISEFSLILGVLGLKLGHITEEVLGLITAVGVVTITLSTYLIVHSEVIFARFSKILKLFERKRTKEIEFPEKEYNKPIILVGCHRTGESIALSLPRDQILVIDFDPEIAHKLKKHGIEYIFGDITDEEIFERANIKNAKLIICTSPELEDNLSLLEKLQKLPKKPKAVVRAENERDAMELYKNGADYVLLPHFTSGQYLGKTISISPTLEISQELKEKDIALLEQMRL